MIIKHEKPVTKLVPIEEGEEDFFGCLKDTVVIQSDLVHPIDVEWEAEE